MTQGHLDRFWHAILKRQLVLFRVITCPKLTIPILFSEDFLFWGVEEEIHLLINLQNNHSQISLPIRLLSQNSFKRTTVFSDIYLESLFYPVKTTCFITSLFIPHLVLKLMVRLFVCLFCFRVNTTILRTVRKGIPGREECHAGTALNAGVASSSTSQTKRALLPL